MSYHDNKPNWKGNKDEDRAVREAGKNLDPKRYGQDLAEKIAEECCEKIERAVDADSNMSEERGRNTVKEIIKETVKENL